MCAHRALVNVAVSCVGAEVCVYVHLLQIFLLVGNSPLLKDFVVHLKHSRLQKVSFDHYYLTSVDIATLLAGGLSENRALD